MINFLRTLCIIFFAAVIGNTAFADNHLPPLHLAAANGDIAEVKRLIDGGADVNAEYETYRLHTFDQKTTAEGGQIDEIDGGATGFIRFFVTPLHGAARFGHTETALALIKAGADINIKDKTGWTPLHAAASQGQTETALALIKAGADINAKEENGGMSLHFALGLGHTETALALIKAGAVTMT